MPPRNPIGSSRKESAKPRDERGYRIVEKALQAVGAAQLRLRVDRVTAISRTIGHGTSRLLT